MRWNSMLRTFAFFLVTIISLSEGIETQDHAPSSDKTYHFPSASLTIAGDLKDVKLKGTIAQLVRALQQPSASAQVPPQPKEDEAKAKTTGTKKIIHPSQLITKHTLGKGGKKLYYGDPIPDTITVSSQPVKVSQSNTTGGKRTRHLGAYIGNRPSVVRTIEGVRAPDDEADKHYTWRNARVIKGFLVPNDRPANPHKKRQVIFTDPQQYLAAAAAAQAQGATTIIETSGLQGSTNGQPKTSIFYAQEPAQASGVSNSNGNSAAIFANSDPSHQRSHSQVVYQNQQPAQTTNNGQTGAFAYTPQQNAHMYVVQDSNGNAYNMQYTANQASAHQQQAQLAQQQAQAQFFSRSGEASTAPVVSQNPSTNSQQGSGASNLQQQQQQQAQQSSLSAAIRQQQYQSSLDTQAIQAAVEAVQQLEAQQNAAAAAAAGNNQGLSQQQQQQQQQQAPTIQQAQHQQIQIAQQSAPSQQVVLPQGASLISGATAQEILAATAAATNGQVTAQYIQIQPGQEQSLAQLQQSQTQQQQQQQQYPAHNQFAERQAVPGIAGAFPANPTQFVIQPQTYLTGAGGQAFTVPIPVPVEQAVAQASHQQSQQVRLHQQLGQHSQQQQFHNNNHNQYQNQNQHHQQQQQHSQHHQQQQHSQHNHQQQQNSQHQQQQHSQHHQQLSSNNNNNRHQQGPNQSSITDRMKQAFNQNFNRKMLERVETNAVVPALASTGLFLGLSALAAGWYLSKSNREVGIVRRTGILSSKKTGTTNNGANNVETKDKESPTTRTRRDLASMVTPGAYNPSGGPEVDQATFFQSIIQQSLEKTQKEYDDEPVYNQNQEAINNNNNNEQQMAYHHQSQREPEPERHAPPSPPMPPPSRYRTKNNNNRYNERPAKYYREEDLYDPSGNSRISKAQQIQEKSGGWAVHSAKNFARVAIPAVVLTGAALGICAVIFGWYISGDNREIAFLESPTTNSIGQNGWSRKKRSLLGPTAISDGWLIRTLKAIHGNPYDNMPAPTAKSFVPYPYFLDKDSSKTSSLEFKVSNNGLAGVLAGGAVLAVVALGLINSFTESSGRNLKTARYNQLLTHSAAYTNTNAKHANPLTHLRAPRAMAHFENDLEFQQALSSPSFFESILSSLEASGDTIMNKLHELGSSQWHESPCAKRILCQVMTSQGDDTVKLMEKKMATVLKMMPESVSSSMNENFSDVLSAINKRDCSSFTCSLTHRNKSTARIVHISAPSSSHHKSSSIKIEQTVTNSR